MPCNEEIHYSVVEVTQAIDYPIVYLQKYVTTSNVRNNFVHRNVIMYALSSINYTFDDICTLVVLSDLVCTTHCTKEIRVNVIILSGW